MALVGALRAGSEPQEGAVAVSSAPADEASEPDDAPDDADAASPEGTTGASPSKTQACGREDVLVTASVSEQSFTGSQQPVLSMTVENVSSRACSADVGTKAQSFTVGSGETQVWSSAPCVEKPVSSVRTIEPGRELSGRVTWDRSANDGRTCTRSASTIGVNGTYWVQAAVGDWQSDRVRFSLK